MKSNKAKIKTAMKKKPSMGKKDAGDKNMKGRGALQRKLEGKEL